MRYHAATHWARCAASRVADPGVVVSRAHGTVGAPEQGSRGFYFVSATYQGRSLLSAATQLTRAVRDAMGSDRPPHLVTLFATPQQEWGAGLAEIPQHVREMLTYDGARPPVVVGGVLRNVAGGSYLSREGEPCVTLLAAHLPGVRIMPFSAAQGSLPALHGGSWADVIRAARGGAAAEATAATAEQQQQPPQARGAGGAGPVDARRREETLAGWVGAPEAGQQHPPVQPHSQTHSQQQPLAAPGAATQSAPTDASGGAGAHGGSGHGSGVPTGGSASACADQQSHPGTGTGANRATHAEHPAASGSQGGGPGCGPHAPGNTTIASSPHPTVSRPSRDMGSSAQPPSSDPQTPQNPRHGPHQQPLAFGAEATRSQPSTGCKPGLGTRVAPIDRLAGAGQPAALGTRPPAAAAAAAPTATAAAPGLAAAPPAPPAAEAPAMAVAALLLSTPHFVETEELLRRFGQVAPGMQVVGGVTAAGAWGDPESNWGAVWLNDRTMARGAVGCVLQGPFRLDTIVSPGFRGAGPVMRVTRSEGRVVWEVDGEPVQRPLQRAISEALNAGDFATALKIGVGDDTDDGAAPGTGASLPPRPALHAPSADPSAAGGMKPSSSSSSPASPHPQSPPRPQSVFPSHAAFPPHAPAGSAAAAKRSAGGATGVGRPSAAPPQQGLRPPPRWPPAQSEASGPQLVTRNWFFEQGPPRPSLTVFSSESVAPGTAIQVHLQNYPAAHREMRDRLRAYVEALPPAVAASQGRIAALALSCSGLPFFEGTDVARWLPKAAFVGGKVEGELCSTVRGRPSRLHSFTSCLAILRAADPHGDEQLQATGDSAGPS